MLDLIDKYADEYAPFIQKMTYRGGGILPSELLALLCICKDRNIERVLESGRHQGFSTLGLSGHGWDVHSTDILPIIAVDRELANRYPISLELGSMDAGRFFSNKFPSTARSLMLLDGPKGKPAVRLIQQYAEQLVCGAIHDMSKMADDGTDHPMPNESRAAAEQAGLPVFFTDDQAYVDKYGYLDDVIWTDGYHSRADLTKHGFTLAIFLGGRWSA